MRDPLLMEPKALHSGMILRPIRREDDPAMARIIRQVMTEFSAVGAGFWAKRDPPEFARSQGKRRYACGSGFTRAAFQGYSFIAECKCC